MSTSLRARYMDHEDTFSFHEYWGALVEYIGEERLQHLLPVQHTPEQWRVLLAADEHLNNVPLHQWDRMHNLVRPMIRTADEGYMAITGWRAWSLSDTVCVLKETARRYAETSIAT